MFGQWPTVVGHHIAEHATPTALREGVLTVTAESTAWATQLRIIQNQVLAKIAAEVGDGVVTSLRITGPVAPSWRKGRCTSPDEAPETPMADPTGRSAESRQNAASSLVKRQDEARSEKFRTRRR